MMQEEISKNLFKEMGISDEVYNYSEKILENLSERFAQIDAICEYNQLKVLKALQDCRVSEACLYGSTGYGYNDIGRDTLEQVYAHIFHTEDALVRPQITCGTHALALALMSNLRPGDELLSPVGKPYDTLEEVIKQGTLTVGFIGLAECLKALIGEHHGESEDAQKLGLEIIGHMRKRMDEASEKYGLNFSVIATPAEGLSGRFVKIDKKRYGIIPGVTDRDYYTNSFHVPVYFPISAFKKLAIEGKYHALTNAGHISYVELDGDPQNNVDAFEAIVRCMHDTGFSETDWIIPPHRRAPFLHQKRYSSSTSVPRYV